MLIGIYICALEVHFLLYPQSTGRDTLLNSFLFNSSISQERNFPHLSIQWVIFLEYSYSIMFLKLPNFQYSHIVLYKMKALSFKDWIARGYRKRNFRKDTSLITQNSTQHIHRDRFEDGDRVHWIPPTSQTWLCHIYLQSYTTRVCQRGKKPIQYKHRRKFKFTTSNEVGKGKKKKYMNFTCPLTGSCPFQNT